MIIIIGDNEPWRRYDASVRPMRVIEIAERAKRHAITSSATVSSTSSTSPNDVKRVVDRVISSHRDVVHAHSTSFLPSAISI